MTPFLIALVVLVGAIVIGDLLLTVAVIRRLRQHTEQLSSLTSFGGPPGELVLPAGERAGEFAATTTDGEPVSRDLLSGQTLVGVLSAGCGACKERLPEFVSRAATFPGGRGQVLAVLAGAADEVELYREQLAPVARVIIEAPIDGPVAQALGVQAFPAFALLDAEGTVAASGLSLGQLPVVSPAAA